MLNLDTITLLTKQYSKPIFYTGTSTDSTSTVLTRSRLQKQNDIKMDINKLTADFAVVSQDTLLVCYGFYSCMVELVSSQTGEVLSQLELEGVPMRVCLVGRDRAVVTLETKPQVELIKIKGNTIAKDKLLKLHDKASGITTSGNNLVVSYCMHPWLEVISIDGKVLKRFHSTGKKQHFALPEFITTLPDGTLWVSDQGNGTITKMDVNLTILQTFTMPLLEYPFGITAVTEDEILVCSERNNSLVLLQPSTNTMSTLLGEDDGIKAPYSLTYCPQERKIYVTNDNNNINVFKVI